MAWKLPSASAPSFAEAAQKLTRGQLLDILLDVEERLRALVRAVFASKVDDWESLIPKGIRDELAPPRDARDDALQRATLKQLIDMILAKWPLFQPILDDKAWVTSTFEEFRKHRNALAHGDQPDPDEKVQITLVASKIGQRLPAIVVSQDAALDRPPSHGLTGKSILWADDRPEGNRRLRGLFENLGATVIPVLSNEEAMMEMAGREFDVIISDIDRGGGEPGSELGVKLRATGRETPIVFFVARADRSLPLPLNAVAVSNDTAEVIALVLGLLRPDAMARLASR